MENESSKIEFTYNFSEILMSFKILFVVKMRTIKYLLFLPIAYCFLPTAFCLLQICQLPILL